MHIIFPPDGMDSLEDAMFTTLFKGQNPPFCLPVKLKASVELPHIWKGGQRVDWLGKYWPFVTSLIPRTPCNSKDFMERGEEGVEEAEGG